jgi:hypothetical protein
VSDSTSLQSDPPAADAAPTIIAHTASPTATFLARTLAKGPHQGTQPVGDSERELQSRHRLTNYSGQYVIVRESVSYSFRSPKSRDHTHTRRDVQLRNESIS